MSLTLRTIELLERKIIQVEVSGVVLCFILICINKLLFMYIRVENSCMHGHCVAKAGDDSNRFLVLI